MIVFGGMNNNNLIGSSLMTFDLDSHLHPASYKKNHHKYENRNITRHKSLKSRPNTNLKNCDLPPIK